MHLHDPLTTGARAVTFSDTMFLLGPRVYWLVVGPGNRRYVCQSTPGKGVCEQKTRNLDATRT